MWAKRDWANIGGKIRLGGFVKFTDERFQKEGVLVRITGIKDYINSPHSPELTLSNSTVSSGFSTTMQELKSEEVIIDSNHRSALEFTKRRFRDAKETISMLEDALLDNFTNSISPIAVQTMSMLVGDESLQFRFIRGALDQTQVSDTVTWNNDTKKLTIKYSTIQHLTLGIKDISSAHQGQYKIWSLPAYTSAILTDGKVKYYLYAKCSQEDTTGEFILSEEAIPMETGGFIYLLVGVLNSEYDGERSFVSLYGFSEILPGRITTDRVVSADGKSWIDLQSGAMQLGEKLKYADNKLILDFLFAEGANIGGWVFRNGRLESQDGTIWLDGTTGDVMVKGRFEGYLSADSLFLPFKRNLKNDITLTVDAPTNIILKGTMQDALLTLPDRDEAFNGMFLNVYFAPRISKMDGQGILLGRIRCPNKNTVFSGSSLIKEYFAKEIYSELGGIVQLVNLQGTWTLLNGSDSLIYTEYIG